MRAVLSVPENQDKKKFVQQSNMSSSMRRKTQMPESGEFT